MELMGASHMFYLHLVEKPLNFTAKETNGTDAFEGEKMLNDWTHFSHSHSHKQSYSHGKTWTRS